MAFLRGQTSRPVQRTSSRLGRSLSRLRFAQRLRADAGMTTAEYAVGMVAACGFAGILYKLLTSGSVLSLLTALIKRALELAF